MPARRARGDRDGVGHVGRFRQRAQRELVHDRPLQAVDAPRFRVVMTNDEIELDADVPEDVKRDLVARGHQLGDPKDFKGAAQMVRLHRGEGGVGPCLESGVDHRLDGVALGW